MYEHKEHKSTRSTRAQGAQGEIGPQDPLLQQNVLFSTGITLTTTPNKVYYLTPSGDWDLADYNNSATKLIL